METKKTGKIVSIQGRRGKKNAVPVASEALASPSEKIRILLGQGSEQHTLSRYGVGEVVNEVKADLHKYGKAGVKQIARSLGRRADTLYDCGRVAACWPRGEFEVLAARLNRYGVCLSFSHFIHLADLSSAALRHKWLERCLQDGLALRSLRQAVRAEHRAEKVHPGHVRFVPTRSLQRLQRLSTTLVSGVEAWCDGLLAQVADGPPSDEQRALLEQALQEQAKLQESAQQAIARMEAMLKRNASQTARSA